MTKHNWRILKNQQDYDMAMSRLIELADKELEPNTSDFDEFELVSLLVGHYEENHFPMDKPSPIEAIKFRMDQQGLSQKDMTQYIGSASKVSEVLSGKRKLSLSMIKRIHDGLGIPLDVLIQDSSFVDEWCKVTPTSMIKKECLVSGSVEVPERYADYFYADEKNTLFKLLAYQYVNTIYAKISSRDVSAFKKRHVPHMATKKKSTEITFNQNHDNEYSLVAHENNINFEISCPRFH